MSNNQEIIEARLAAYVDNELEPGEQVEIETHLQQNPQYRRLVEELRRGRDMIRGLPREAAPPEFAEAFATQLERSGLLGLADAEVHEPGLRIGAPTRHLAAAAIVLLALGLGIAVYYIIPQLHSRTVALAPTTPKPTVPAAAPANSPKASPASVNAAAEKAKAPPVPATALASGKPDALSADRSLTSAGAAPTVSGTAAGPAAAAAAPGAVAMAPGRPSAAAPAPAAPSALAFTGSPASAPAVAPPVALAMNAGQRSTIQPTAPIETPTAHPHYVDLDQLARSVLQNPRTAGQANGAPALSSNAIVMVVSAADSSHVQQELDAYCRSNNLDLKEAGQSSQFAFADDKVEELKKVEAMRRKVAAIAAPAPTAAKGAAEAWRLKDSVVAERVEKQVAVPLSGPVFVARRLSQQQAQELNARLSRSGAVQQTLVMSGLAQEQAAQASLDAVKGADREIRPAPAPLAMADAPAPEGRPAADNAPQAQDKRRLAAGAEPDRGAENKTRLGSAATTLPADGLVHKGDDLRVVYSSEPGAAEKSETVRVQEDGTVDPKVLAPLKLKPVDVAGKTLAEARKALQPADSVAGADLPVDVPTIARVERVEPPTALARSGERTAQFGQADKEARESETARAAPTSNGYGAGAGGSPAIPGLTPAATAPNALLGQAAPNPEALVDVVIVLRHFAAPAATAPADDNLPATAPVRQ